MISQLPLTFPSWVEAVIVVVPGAMPRTVPPLSATAIPWLAELKFNESTAAEPAGVIVTVRLVELPASIGFVLGLMVIFSTTAG